MVIAGPFEAQLVTIVYVGFGVTFHKVEYALSLLEPIAD